jgi:hypothetical protein
MRQNWIGTSAGDVPPDTTLEQISFRLSDQFQFRLIPKSSDTLLQVSIAFVLASTRRVRGNLFRKGEIASFH